MSLSDLIVLSLATLYLAYALTKTHGAGGLFAWVREHLPLGGLTSCIVCAAFWIGMAFYGLWLTPLQPIVYVFAAAGGAVVIGNYVGLAQK